MRITRWPGGRLWLLAVSMLCASFAAQSASYRVQEGAEDSTVILPPGYSRDGNHPAVILLPYTGGSAEDLFHWYYASSYARQNGPQPVLVLLEDEGDFSDYKSGEAWSETVEEYEQEVKAVVDDLVARYGVDRSRIALGGFSMGGDLGWALALRNPELFSGVVIMGSRCTWRQPANVAKLRNRGVKVAFFLGAKDRAVRVKGLKAARDLLAKAGVSVRYKEMTDRGHLPAPAEAFWDALHWLFSPLETASVPAADSLQ